MAQVVLADEINRATPKTQSALLECMEERQVTIDGRTYPMPSPFLVLATQNPIEYEGTFALPEAQLDRFMLRLRLGYPSPSEEIVVMDQQKRVHPLGEIGEVVSVEELLAMQATVREMYVDPVVADYIVRLTGATRSHADVQLGASPRGSLALYRAAQAMAALDGRDYAIPDDVKIARRAGARPPDHRQDGGDAPRRRRRGRSSASSSRRCPSRSARRSGRGCGRPNRPGGRRR